MIFLKDDNNICLSHHGEAELGNIRSPVFCPYPSTQPCPRAPPQSDTTADLRSRRADVIHGASLLRDGSLDGKYLASHGLFTERLRVFHLGVCCYIINSKILHECRQLRSNQFKNDYRLLQCVIFELGIVIFCCLHTKLVCVNNDYKLVRFLHDTIRSTVGV